MREWVSSRDTRWVMRCDVQRANGSRCDSQTVPSPSQPPLADCAREGWFIADLSGDVCPACLAKGYQPTVKAHAVMGVDR